MYKFLKFLPRLKKIFLLFFLFGVLVPSVAQAKELSCTLSRHINIDSLLRQEYKVLAQYLSDADFNDKQFGRATLRTDSYKKFGVDKLIPDVGLEFYRGRVMAVLIAAGDIYAEKKETDDYLSQLMNGCGKKVSEYCWNLNGYEVDATAIYPGIIRIQANNILHRLYGRNSLGTNFLNPCVRHLSSSGN